MKNLKVFALNAIDGVAGLDFLLMSEPFKALEINLIQNGLRRFRTMKTAMPAGT